jgi:16S rRNA (cytosine967-C5)-methyltransferase
MDRAQALAAELVADVLGGHSLREERLREEARSLPAQSALLRDLCLGTLRWLGRTRALVALLATRGLGDPRLEALLCVALQQLIQERAAPYAVVDHAVRAARRLGHDRAAGFVNAVLRRFLREKEALCQEVDRSPAARLSHPDWWITALESQYGSATAAGILEASLAHPPMTLRVNRRRLSPEAALALLRDAGLSARRTGPFALTLDKPVPVSDLPGHADGLLSIQDAGAQWAAPLLDLHDGQRVLDACAAPGGKAGHLLETADIELTALDADAQRLQAVRQTLERLRSEATVIAADAAVPAAWWDGRPYDRILLDAPCSGSGIVRRHPDAKWLRRPDDIARFARQQMALLRALWQLLAPGGKLLYVTCSVFSGENTGVVDRWLELVPGARRLSLPEDFPGHAGQLLPDPAHDGFFYALLEKTRDR